MSDYVVTINDNKHLLKILSNNRIELNKKEQQVEFSQLSKYSYLLKVNDKVYQVIAEKKSSEKYNLTIAGHSFQATVRTNLEEKANEYLKNKASEIGTEILKAPMPGLIVKVLKKVGDVIEVGEPLIILEAMKMENEIRATASGVVKSVAVAENSSVEKGAALLEIG